MALRLRGLGVIGAIVLLIGVCLAFAQLRRFYPGLFIAIGCLCCAVFLLVNEAAWRDPSGSTE